MPHVHNLMVVSTLVMLHTLLQFHFQFYQINSTKQCMSIEWGLNNCKVTLRGSLTLQLHSPHRESTTEQHGLPAATQTMQGPCVHVHAMYPNMRVKQAPVV